VEIELVTGQRRRGQVWITTGKSLADVLNGGQPFLEVVPLGELPSCFVAKAQIVSAHLLEMPKYSPLHERRKSGPSDDPYEILAVSRGAPWSVVRDAYLKLAKLYHPDRYSSIDLPAEVQEYIGSRARRINAAYSILEQSQKPDLAAPAK
jgi:hypothetical protein